MHEDEHGRRVGYRTDDRAVSPVIGVVLLVAITVTLAAVVGSLAFGIGEGRDPAPRATFDTSIEDAGNSALLTITHEGGDGIDAARTRVTVELVESDGTGDPAGDADIASPADAEAVLTAGDTVVYDVRANSFTGKWSGRSVDHHELTDPDAGERVRVTIVDVEAGAVVYEETFPVT